MKTSVYVLYYSKINAVAPILVAASEGLCSSICFFDCYRMLIMDLIQCGILIFSNIGREKSW